MSQGSQSPKNRISSDHPAKEGAKQQMVGQGLWKIVAGVGLGGGGRVAEGEIGLALLRRAGVFDWGAGVEGERGGRFSR